MLLPLLACRVAQSQVFTINTEQVNAKYLQFEPTHVELPKMHAGPYTVEALLRTLGSERATAMRPLPLASKGLILVANGPLSPSGSDYVDELNSKGVSSHPGDRVTVTKILVKKDRLILELNGGPDLPHKFLRHVQIGTGSLTTPVAQDTGEQAVGSRLTLVFPGGVPNVTADEVKALIAPVLGFGEKSPLQAYVETLPPFLKTAVLQHRVLVGMDTDMVLHAVGAPVQKVRERDEGRLFEEWIYGVPPQKTEFIRLQHGRVSRVEDASVGTTPIVRTANEVGDYWQTEQGLASTERQIKLGDRSEADRIAENAPTAPPPTLRRPGEVLPADSDPHQSTQKPVQFPPAPKGDHGPG